MSQSIRCWTISSGRMTPDLIASAREQVAKQVELRGLPGLSVAVTSKDGLVAAEAFGCADVAAARAMTRETFLEIGSIGKTFTAVVLLLLQEQGRLSTCTTRWRGTSPGSKRARPARSSFAIS